MKGDDFNPNDYIWKLGQRTLWRLIRNSDVLNCVKEGEASTLFGIKIEYDFENRDALKLYEDITNKI